MSAGTKRRVGDVVVFWAMLTLALCLLGAMPARAQVRPATHPIVNRRLQRVVEMIPGSATDLPPYLVKPQDVYLLVTAGASYTDVQVLANPEVPPQTIANALSSALAGTPLQGQMVEWSVDRYSVAQVSEDHHHFGAMRGSNVVSIAPLMVGLRRVGLTPHLLLRTARYAQTSLPSPHYGTKAFRWYDTRHLVGQGSVTVTATLSPLALAAPLSFLLAVPVIGLLGLWLAGFLSSRGQRDDTARRQVFRKVNSYAMLAAMLALFASIFPFFHALVLNTLADLWFGSSSIAIFVPCVIIAAAPLVLLLVVFRNQETRRFEAVIAGPAIPMSDEEKAVRKRVARYSMVPHLIGALALGAVPFFVTRTSPLYPFIHPVAMFLPMVGAVLVGRIFQKRLDKFTQKTLDDDLTWRARQLGQTLGVRMPDVFVEDSSRAAHLVSVTHQGHHITLSRKLQATFTAVETDFVLAHHLACMRQRGGGDKKWLWVLLVCPVLVPALLIVSRHIFPGGPTLTTLILSSWFLPVVIGYFVLTLVLTMVLLGGGTQRQAKQQEISADRAALEATGNLAAAESALDKLGAAAALFPEVQAMGQLSSSFAGSAGKNVVQLAAGQVMLRRAALQKTAQTLRFAPAPGARTVAQEASPFSSSDADRR